MEYEAVCVSVAVAVAVAVLVEAAGYEVTGGKVSKLLQIHRERLAC